jgi:glycosyltransferase involved in cell wall biosynthesis
MRKKLLAISPVPPWPALDGMSLRISRLLEELSAHWSIILVCPEGGESAASRSIPVLAQVTVPRKSRWMYNPSQYDHGPLRIAVAEAVAVHNPALVLLWGGMDYLRDEIPEMPPMVSDRVDCWTLANWRQLFHRRGQIPVRRRLGSLAYAARYEFRMRRSSGATVVVGERDAEVLRRVLRVRNVHVIPNGVDVPDRIAVSRSPNPTVMFTGIMSFQPNIDAVMHFVDNVWPEIRRRIPDAVFQIVGRSPVPEIKALGSRPNIEVHADVESVQLFLARAWLAIAPMRSGAGIKNKILEAWSVGTPAVMTPIATNGLTTAPKDLLLAAEGSNLAVLVCDLLQDSKRRAELGALARETAKDRFSWHTHAITFDRLLQNVARLDTAPDAA